MKELILITGASSGIGYQMAKLLARQNFDLIIVARRNDLLQKLKIELEREHKVSVHTYASDLSIPQNAIQLYNNIKSNGLQPTMLINNAGFGAYGDFLDIPLETQVEMVNLNITSLMILSQLFLKDRKSTNHGKLMNIASLLSYIPFPFWSVYSATKTFVLAFTETVAAEFEGTKIEIKSLCPGPIATDFTTAEMLKTNAYRVNKPLSAEQVAAAGVKHLLHGRGSKKVGLNNWFISNLPRITPDFLMMKIKKSLSSQPHA